jgi:SAM-dependent methyltransferase
VERVDAVDFSQAMLAKGKQLTGGDHPHLNWIYGRIEEVPLQPPYALITAGSSLHWMEWDIVLPLFQRILTPHGYLALVDRGAENPSPWDATLVEIVRRYSTNREYEPFDLVEELEQRHLFVQEGAIRTQPILFSQSVEDFIRSIHSMNGFSRQRMGEAAANAFDDEVRKLLTPYQQDGYLTQSTVDTIVWGKPVSF